MATIKDAFQRIANSLGAIINPATEETLEATNSALADIENLSEDEKDSLERIEILLTEIRDHQYQVMK